MSKPRVANETVSIKNHKGIRVEPKDSNSNKKIFKLFELRHPC